MHSRDAGEIGEDRNRDIAKAVPAVEKIRGVHEILCLVTSDQIDGEEILTHTIDIYKSIKFIYAIGQRSRMFCPRAMAQKAKRRAPLPERGVVGGSVIA
ncbi:hypothetical protein [Caballeronia sp. J97]|uniref:hypothetical protein n=1 Tax=Caballeronia sp. J97 TaxID=2805429 RepID=UPI002AB18217|nr:hypothetical protein [Caballeronia sp. J97]